MNSNEFLLDSGFWGFLYKILTPVEWLQTWIMKIVHDFFVMLGVSRLVSHGCLPLSSWCWWCRLVSSRCSTSR